MWSHYSNSHKGVCIGLDLKKKLYASIKDMVPALLKVKYTNKLEKINYFSHTKDALINCFRTKSELWEYEKEIRIALFDLTFDKNNHYLIPFKKEILTELYLGSMIPQEDEQEILLICRQNYPNTKIYKMKLDNESF